MKSHLLIAASVASIFVASSAAQTQTQNRCRERDPCTVDNVITEVRKEVASAPQRASRESDATSRVGRAASTMDCVMRCISEAITDATRRTSSNSSASAPE